MSNNDNTHVQLNDGKTVIDLWPHAFATLPTIGETVDINRAGGSTPAGYQSQAQVFRIDRDLASGRVTVVLDLQPATTRGDRTVVFLNADYIPLNLRREVEEHLRGKLPVPAFEWVESNDPSPILRIHRGLAETAHEEVAKLQKGVRRIIDEASPLATV